MSTFNLTTSENLDWRLTDLVTRETYDNISKGGSGSATIYGIPMGGSYEEFKEQASKLKTQHQESLTHDQQLNLAYTGLDPNAPTSYMACLQSEVMRSNGLHAAVIGATDTDISILIRWFVPNAGTVQATWSGASQLTSFFPNELSQGDFTVVVPRPTASTSIAGNVPGYSTGQIVLEPLPPPPTPVSPPPPAAWKQFSAGNMPTLDGDGNHVGQVSNMVLNLYVDPTNPSSAAEFRFAYGYYNGSGTWRGTQRLTITLLSRSGATIETIQVPISRETCVYGGAQPRKFEGKTAAIDASQVVRIAVQIGRVQGVQTRC